MIRFLVIVLSIIVMFVSCKTDGVENQPIVLKNQQIGITSAHNVRQLGGYPIGDKRIKDNVLLRSAKLSELSVEDSTLLSDKYKVQYIYDFRGKKESLSAPDVIPGEARYLSLSLPFAGDEIGFDVQFESEEQMIGMLLQYADHPSVQAMCTSMYDLIFFEESSQEVYRQFFADLVKLDPEDGAVLWHCTQGKDRTGVVAAAILLALGVDRDAIMRDYMKTNRSCRFKNFWIFIGVVLVTFSVRKARNLNLLLSSRRDFMRAAFDEIDRVWGGTDGFLRNALQLTEDELFRLREAYLV